MIAPTVHLNGTSQGELLRAYSDATAAVDAALRALSETSPHARDYYVQAPDAYGRAAVEHSLRVEKLTDVYDELLALFNAVDAQGGGR